MLAGRKLLLADDSITIQRVVDLTFADEGIHVVSIDNGAEAIARLEEINPDVVLADVFMPGMTGYEVCEYIKGNERFKHIPVMLLVGSFEPFDEAEARRVGADDILTKPFQSIRSLIDRVGALMGREQPASLGLSVRDVEPDTSERQAAATPSETVVESQPVAQLESTPAATASVAVSENVVDEFADTIERAKPQPEHVEEVMSASELAVTTADTQPLSTEMLGEVFNGVESAGKSVAEKMEAHAANEKSTEFSEGFGDVLLDLGDEPVGARTVVTDDDVLDIGFDSGHAAAPAQHAYANAEAVAVADPPVAAHAATESETWADSFGWEPPEKHGYDTNEMSVVGEQPLRDLPTLNFSTQPALDHAQEVETTDTLAQPAKAEAVKDAPATPTGKVTIDQLAPEVIDAIARRVVEQLSEKVVEGIAWEVVPELAELLIKRKLEEKELQEKF